MKSRIKAWVWAAFRFIGIDAFYRQPDHHYVLDYFGKSSHKQKDIRTLPVFGELAGKVVRDGRCSLYYDRLFTIHQIMVHLSSFEKTEREIYLAEVGVYKGGTSYFIASVAEQLDMNIRHHCFDTFEGHAAEDINKAVEVAHTPGVFGDTSFESVKKYLAEFRNIEIYKGRIQDTSYNVRDTSFRFVHLDMDIYEPTIYALRFFNDRLVKGGVILLDDYGFETCPGIEKAIAEFTSKQTGYFGTSLLSGQYMLVKL